MDVSADLGELARSGCCVVCSGAKAILDLPRTAEALESRGVTVLGYRTDRMPGFYVETTDIAVPPVASVDEAAAIVRAQAALGWPGSIIIGQKPPAELAFSREAIRAAVRRGRRTCPTPGNCRRRS